jgi:hypothetical protein
VAHVFLSYSRADQDVAAELTHRLGLADVDVWSDLDIELGVDWSAEVSRALLAAAAVVVLASPRSIASVRVTYEWSTALACSIRVIPVLTGGTRFEHLPNPLSAAHAWISTRTRTRRWTRSRLPSPPCWPAPAPLH